MPLVARCLHGYGFLVFTLVILFLDNYNTEVIDLFSFLAEFFSFKDGVRQLRRTGYGQSFQTEAETNFYCHWSVLGNLRFTYIETAEDTQMIAIVETDMGTSHDCNKSVFITMFIFV